jgi:ABC-type uncharacterized transport system permease subunit
VCVVCVFGFASVCVCVGLCVCGFASVCCGEDGLAAAAAATPVVIIIYGMEEQLSINYHSQPSVD